jgi:hypothetical protein
VGAVDALCRVDCFFYANFFAVAWLGVRAEDALWWIDGCIDTDFLTKTWLESRSIVSFGNVNGRVEVIVAVVAVRSVYFNSSLSVFFLTWSLSLKFTVVTTKVRTMDVRKLDVDFSP